MSGRTVRDSRTAVFAGVLIVLAAAVCSAGESYLSPVALTVSPDGKTLYVAEATAKQVAVVDVANGRIRNVKHAKPIPKSIGLR